MTKKNLVVVIIIGIVSACTGGTGSSGGGKLELSDVANGNLAGNVAGSSVVAVESNNNSVPATLPSTGINLTSPSAATVISSITATTTASHTPAFATPPSNSVSATSAAPVTATIPTNGGTVTSGNNTISPVTSTSKPSSTPTAVVVSVPANVASPTQASGTVSTSETSNADATGSTSTQYLTVVANPANTTLVGVYYSFVPTIGGDTEGDVSFTIVNCPSWATFNVATGELSGTPTLGDVGTYSNILISVASREGSSASLKPFSIAVVQNLSGSAVVSWSPPKENVDGHPVTNLSGYRIYYGLSAAGLTQKMDITGASNTTAVVTNLSQGMWYFSVKAVTSTNIESSASNTESKVIL